MFGADYESLKISTKKFFRYKANNNTKPFRNFSLLRSFRLNCLVLFAFT